MKHRNVKHFGYEFIYGKNDVDKSNPLQDGIPEVCSTITEKMQATGIVDWTPDQLTVNEYAAGQGMSPKGLIVITYLNEHIYCMFIFLADCVLDCNVS